MTTTPRTLFELFLATARRHPDEPAVSDATRALTYRELCGAALDLCRVGRDLRVQPADVAPWHAQDGL